MKVRHADLTSKYDHIVTSYCDEEGKKTLRGHRGNKSALQPHNLARADRELGHINQGCV